MIRLLLYLDKHTRGKCSLNTFKHPRWPHCFSNFNPSTLSLHFRIKFKHLETMSTEASTSTAVDAAIFQPSNLSPAEVLVRATTDIKASVTTLRGTKDVEVWKQVHRRIWDSLVSVSSLLFVTTTEFLCRCLSAGSFLTCLAAPVCQRFLSL